MRSAASPVMVGIFAALVMAILCLDLGVVHRRARVMSLREAGTWTLVWVVAALGFNLLIYRWIGFPQALAFFQGWLVEEALSVDNLFVFLIVFRYFAVPEPLQHRVLFWGILGALLTRGAFIFLGAALLATFQWVAYIFGVFLLLTAFRLLRTDEPEVHPESNGVVRTFKRFVPMTSDYAGTRFLVRQDGRTLATPLLLVLVVLETTDVMFAVDSIPAVFAITTDAFIVYTSNILAVLGLRALCAVVAGLMRELCYLNTGLALVLFFVGGKMLLARLYHVPELVSLIVVVSILTVATAMSLLRRRGQP